MLCTDPAPARWELRFRSSRLKQELLRGLQLATNLSLWVMLSLWVEAPLVSAHTSRIRQSSEIKLSEDVWRASQAWRRCGPRLLLLLFLVWEKNREEIVPALTTPVWWGAKSWNCSVNCCQCFKIEAYENQQGVGLLASLEPWRSADESTASELHRCFWSFSSYWG